MTGLNVLSSAVQPPGSENSLTSPVEEIAQASCLRVPASPQAQPEQCLEHTQAA